jgi:hypothetical protein
MASTKGKLTIGECEIMPVENKTAPQITRLKPENEVFCREYLKTSNGTRSYALSRGANIEDAEAYQVCAAEASRLLKHVKICARLNELMDLEGFNDTAIDKELNYLAHQHADLKVKIAAIKEYNVLKQRISKGNVFQGNTFNLAQILQKANE